LAGDPKNYHQFVLHPAAAFDNRGNYMRKTNEELDMIIAGQQAAIAGDAGKADIRRGHVARFDSQLVKNRAEAIKTLESQKELTSVNLRAGI
jgi:hypothetical protein